MTVVTAFPGHADANAFPGHAGRGQPLPRWRSFARSRFMVWRSLARIVDWLHQ